MAGHDAVGSRLIRSGTCAPGPVQPASKATIAGSEGRPRASAGRGDLASVYANAKILSEALPFMQRYDNTTVVVKYGGHAMGDPELAANSPATSC